VNNATTDLIVYSMIVAGILVMTRPGSQGPALVNNLTHGYARIVQAVTGQHATA
jgi:hypothetical protein